MEGSFRDALVATLMLFFGIGTLYFPYTIAEGGFAGLIFLILVGILYWFTLILMTTCMNHTDFNRYQQVAAKAFGEKGKLVTMLLYLETGASLVGFLVWFGDIITYLFPVFHHHLRVWSIVLFCVILMPTTWSHNMTIITCLSYCCAMTIALTSICVCVHIALHRMHPTSLPALVWPKIPKAIAIFSFTFGSTPVLPSIYASMARRSQFKLVAILSFSGFILISYGFGFVGAARFGDRTQPIILLNLPRHAIISKVAIWSSLVIPAAQFTMLLCPITADISEFSRVKFSAHRLVMCILSSLMVLVIMTVAILLPKFAGVIELVGACLDMVLGVVLPPIFYLKIFGATLTLKEKVQTLTLNFVGSASAIVGTVASFEDLMK